MKQISLTAVCACCALFSSPVLAEPAHGGHADHGHAEVDTKPVNAMCPVGKEPVEEDGGRAVYKGNTIGFCCPGCIDKFNAWDESKKDEFVAMSIMDAQPAMHDDHAAIDAHEADEATVPYIFNTCPISGEELGGMGDSIVKVYDGREVKYCCMMCVPKFEKDLKASFAALDQQIIESQLPFYPTTTCIVSGEPLGDEDMGDPINFVYNNRLIRFCCKMCKGDFKKDPEAYIAKLDAAVISQQSDNYPLTTCPISGEDLGAMGDAINVVYGGRLVKLCCQMCIPKFEADPMPTIEKIDAAWMAMHKDGGAINHHDQSEDRDSHGEHSKGGHNDG